MAETLSNDVFICYRREPADYLALALFQNLTERGIDVFYDFENIGAGKFGRIILDQIAARPYMILIMTPGTLERCADPADWLRLEIETAVSLEREIIPLYTHDFDHGHVARYLRSETSAALMEFNMLELPPIRYFNDTVDVLVRRFLEPKPVASPNRDPSDQLVVDRQLANARAAPPVAAGKLDAAELTRRGHARRTAGDIEGAMTDYTRALQIDPLEATAFAGRAEARLASGDTVGGIADYTSALEIDPSMAIAFRGRGDAYGARGDIRKAVFWALRGRGHAHVEEGDIEKAIDDLTAALAVDPADAETLALRGKARAIAEDFDGAIDDYSAAIKLLPSGSGLRSEWRIARGWVRARAGQSLRAKLDFLNSPRGLQEIAELRRQKRLGT